MSNGECTSSGTRVWYMLNIVYMTILIAEFAAFKRIWVNYPESEGELGLLSAIAVVGTIGGLMISREGLTNADFNMTMRTALTAIGAILAGGALIAALSLCKTCMF